MPMKWHPIIEVVAGILILIWPRLVAYVIGTYLILIGLMGLIGGRF
jgi:hypothetical protein